MRKLTLVLLLACASVSAQDTKISDLPSGTPMADADVFPIARSGANYKIPGSDLCRVADCTMTAPILGPTTIACSAPGYSFSADAGAGLCLATANNVRIQVGVQPDPSGVGIVTDTQGSFGFYDATTANYTGWLNTDAQSELRADGETVGIFLASSITLGDSDTQDQVKDLFVSMGAASKIGTRTHADLTDNRTWTFPDATGDVAVIASLGFPVRTAAQTWATRCLAAGTGISISNECGTAGNITVSLDTSTTPQFSSGTGDVPATGALGTQYFETDVPGMYVYPVADTEHWLLSIAAGQTAGRLFQTDATDRLVEITPTDETVLVSNGTTWEKKTLPDCTDTGGNHINYTASSNTFSCGTSGGGGVAVLAYSAPGGIQIGTNSIQYLPAWGGSGTVSATETLRSVAMADSCTFGNLYITTQSTQPASGTLVATLRIAGAGTAVTITIAAGAGAGVFSDTTHTVAVTAGQLVAIEFDNNATDGASAYMNGWSLTCS